MRSGFPVYTTLIWGWYLLTILHRNRPSNFLVKSVGPWSEWAIDKIFLLTVVVAPVALVGAVWFLLMGNWAPGVLCAAIVPLATLGIYARHVAPWQIRVKRLTPDNLNTFANDPLPNTKPLRIVFFSDLHLGKFKRQAWMQKVVNAVNAHQPDVVLIGGDFVGHTECCDLDELLAPLSQLRAPLGVFAVFGNHDHGVPGPDHSDELAHLFPQLNVRLLHNECVHLRDDLRLVGIAELWVHEDDLPRAIESCDNTGVQGTFACAGPQPRPDVTRRA